MMIFRKVLTSATSATDGIVVNIVRHRSNTETHGIDIAGIQIVCISGDAAFLIVLGCYIEEVFGKISEQPSI